MATQYGRKAILSRRGLMAALRAGLAAAYMGGQSTAFNAAAQAVADRQIKIVAFGDSLTAGFMLPPADAFPAVLARALDARGHRVEMINAGVSGDTTAAGRDRLAWAVPPDTDAVILEFGANDALRGLSPLAARANLEAMITALKAQGAEILLAGMLAPRSLGEDYTKPFDAIFPDLAQKHGLLLYPFFIEAIALKPALNLADGLHPNARGTAAMAAAILPQAEALIARVKARRQTKG